MIKLFDGSDLPDPELKVASTPCELLMAHAMFIERKRQVLSGCPSPDDVPPRGFLATRIDQGPDGTPPTLCLLAMEGSRCSLVAAATSPESAEECVVTHHDGEEGSVMMKGAVAMHLSPGMCLRLCCQLMEAMLPRLTPRLRKIADAFLAEARTH